MLQTLSGVMCENIQFTQAFGNRAATEPLLNELFEESSLSAISAGDDVLLAGGGYDEPLITSTSHNLTPPPLFHENPAGISLQVGGGEREGQGAFAQPKIFKKNFGRFFAPSMVFHHVRHCVCALRLE